ncbi:MAG: methylated-DNA--[protein]-cysteine S-methyltransferase [Prevotellaceae bacterium]|jgi:methylated-DNA-[protein]-cysteine S-methyltransferase|nr:methylated-DNA--[protein]-cysteine S-methyltransferase [Prevotellaceae bacterium]
MATTEYRAYMQSPVGIVIIEANDSFITSVRLTQDCRGQQNTPPLPPHLQQCIEQINEYFAGKRQDFNLPVEQHGTEFQTKVWDKLREIPYGTTISYLELAKRLGNAKLTRAVGGANGKNKLWIIVPCHRVIGSDGSLTGYAGGVHCKQQLLEHEQNTLVNG